MTAASATIQNAIMKLIQIQFEPFIHWYTAHPFLDHTEAAARGGEAHQDDAASPLRVSTDAKSLGHKDLRPVLHLPLASAVKSW